MVNLYSYTAILPIRLIASLLPRPISLFLAEICGSCAYYLMVKSRRQIANNISRAGISLTNTIIRRTFRNYAKYLTDFMYIPRINKNTMDSYFLHYPESSVIDKVVDGRRGTIIVTGHLGHWELGGALLSINRYNVTTVAIRKSGTRAFVDFRERIRKSLNVRTVYVEDNNVSIESLAVLKRGGLIAMLIDRNYDASGIPVTLFNQPFLFPRGPLVLSALTGAVILPASIILDSCNRYNVTLYEPIYVTNSEDRTLKTSAEKLISILEAEIRKHIEQWYNFQGSAIQ